MLNLLELLQNLSTAAWVLFEVCICYQSHSLKIQSVIITHFWKHMNYVSSQVSTVSGTLITKIIKKF